MTIQATPASGIRPRPLRHDLSSWLTAHRHQRIAVLYLIASSFFFVAAVLLGFLLHAEAVTPQADLFEPETFGRLFTLHGQLAVFFFLLPALPAVLGIFLVPSMVGARNVAFPRVNLLSWYCFVAGGFLILGAAAGGGLDSGWMLTYGRGSVGADAGMLPAAIGILLGAISAALVAVNLLATVIRGRNTGSGVRVFVASQCAGAVVTLVATPLLFAAIYLLLSGQAGSGSPALDTAASVRFRILMWSYIHPVIHAPLLCGIGIVTEIFQTFTGGDRQKWPMVIRCIAAIAIFGSLSFGQHLDREVLGSYFWVLSSLFALLVAVPCVMLVVHWLTLLLRGPIRWSPPLIYALVFMGVFTTGGVSGLHLGVLGLGEQLRGTSYEGAHFHYFIAGGVISAFLAGLHYWWPMVTGRRYSLTAARLTAIGVFLGFNFAFLPQFILGYLGRPARTDAYVASLQAYEVLSFAGATVLVGALLVSVFYLAGSFLAGARSERNPWGAKGLEWEAE